MENATKRIRKMRRQGNPGTHGAPVKTAGNDEHYVVALDHAHLRIYRAEPAANGRRAGLQAVEAMDFPAGRQGATDRATDQAGRFPQVRGRAPGMSIDERLPMQREQERRQTRQVAEQVDGFLAEHQDATWDLTASPDLAKKILAALSPHVRRRMRRTVAKELVNHPLPSLQRRLAAG